MTCSPLLTLLSALLGLHWRSSGDLAGEVVFGSMVARVLIIHDQQGAGTSAPGDRVGVTSAGVHPIESNKRLFSSAAQSCASNRASRASISCTTTKTMAMLPDLFPRPEPVHPFPNDAPVEVVSHFQYLGSIVQDDCSSDLEVDSRICKFQSLSCILWYQWKIKPCTKLHILNTIILPTLLYGLKSTVLHEQQIQQLQTLSCIASELFLGFLSGT